jgi:hypothetical protein
MEHTIRKPPQPDVSNHWYAKWHRLGRRLPDRFLTLLNDSGSQPGFPAAYPAAQGPTP